MEKCIDKPAPLAKNAPQILTMKIPVDKIGALIGPGGKNVKALCAQYDVTINTEEAHPLTYIILRIITIITTVTWFLRRAMLSGLI